MSQEITVHVVNGFVTPATENRPAHGGNPAGVVLDADGLSEAEMLSIAGQVGLSETAFVSRSETEGFKLDFFTPNRRIAHCGHATIATVSYMAEIGRVSEGETSKETVDGPRKIIVKDGAAYMEQLAPRYEWAADWADRDVSEQAVLTSLGLTEADLDASVAPVLVNTGNSFLLVAVKDQETLAKTSPDQGKVVEISEKLDLIGYYVFTRDGLSEEVAATTRMFGPRYAIPEEAATGMAAGPLACLLFDHLGCGETRLVIEQGQFMSPASPSLITVELSVAEGKITGLMAGGFGKVMAEKRARVSV